MYGITLFVIISSLATNIIVKSDTIMEPSIIFEDVLPNVTPCSPIQRFLDRCIGWCLEAMKPYLAKGIPKLKIPPFEPYRMQELNIEIQNQFYGNATFENLTIYGLTNYIHHKIEISSQMETLRFEMNFPVIRIDSKHIIKGRLSDMKKEYIMDGRFVDVEANITLGGKFFWDIYNEDKYFEVTNSTVEFNVKELDILMTDINRIVLPYQKTSYVKRVWKTLKSEMLQKIKLIVARIVLETSNKIYLAFPIDILMPVYV